MSSNPDSTGAEQVLRELREEEEFARRQAEQAHTLIPEDIAPELPPLYSQEERGEKAVAHIKLFTPWTSWTWYISEFDPEQRLCFGVVVGHEREYGYFSIDELKAIRGPAGLRIERDLYWRPRALRDCR